MRPTLLALLAALSMTACAADPAPTAADLQIDQDAEHVVVLPDSPGFAPGTEGPDSACSCADDGCVQQWISDNLGCGVCATIECGNGAALEQCATCAQ